MTRPWNKTAALRINPNLTCQSVRLDGVRYYQVFDGDKRIGLYGGNAADAWLHAYNAVSAALEA
jgi:hypothetical protein